MMFQHDKSKTPGDSTKTLVKTMTFSEGMSEFADGDFANFPEDASGDFDVDIFKTIRGTENSKLANQKQVRNSLYMLRL